MGEGSPFHTIAEMERFKKEWDCARLSVLRGLHRKGRGKGNGQSSGKTYGYR